MMRMKNLIDLNLDEPTVTKHFKGHRVSMSVIFNAHVYSTVTFAVRNQLCCERNSEVVDEKEVIFISLKSF